MSPNKDKNNNSNAIACKETHPLRAAGTIQDYRIRGSKVNMLLTDATKAFDKLKNTVSHFTYF